jgi:phage gpG-like protein
MSEQEFLRQINAKAAEIENCVRRILPIKAGRIAKDRFQNNFLLGGFMDGGLHKWKISKRIDKVKGAKGQYKTLMSGRNNLYNSIEYSVSDTEVVIENRVPYAAVHNEGLRAGRGEGFQMPRRQFIGESKELNEEIKEMIENELSKILKL